jgi:hypothetical protein
MPEHSIARHHVAEGRAEAAVSEFTKGTYSSGHLAPRQDPRALGRAGPSIAGLTDPASRVGLSSRKPGINSPHVVFEGSYKAIAVRFVYVAGKYSTLGRGEWSATRSAAGLTLV